MASAAKLQLKKALLAKYPWAKSPLIVGAPMRVMAGPAMAVQVSHAGGIGFLGPQIKRDSIYTDFDEVAKLVQANPVLSPHSSTTLPVGVGFQTWNDDLEHSIPAIAKYKPCAVWLFAPRDGQAEFVVAVVGVMVLADAGDSKGARLVRLFKARPHVWRVLAAKSR